jgi:hypothetical protein
LTVNLAKRGAPPHGFPREPRNRSAARALQCLPRKEAAMKSMTGELQGIWMHAHAEEWRPAVSRVVHWAKRGWVGMPGSRLEIRARARATVRRVMG